MFSSPTASTGKLLVKEEKYRHGMECAWSRPIKNHGIGKFNHGIAVIACGSH